MDFLKKFFGKKGKAEPVNTLLTEQQRKEVEAKTAETLQALRELPADERQAALEELLLQERAKNEILKQQMVKALDVYGETLGYLMYLASETIQQLNGLEGVTPIPFGDHAQIKREFLARTESK